MTFSPVFVAKKEDQLASQAIPTPARPPIDDRVRLEDLRVGDEVVYNHPVLGPSRARVVRLHLKAGKVVGFFSDKWRFLKRSAPIELERIVKAWRSPETVER